MKLWPCWEELANTEIHSFDLRSCGPYLDYKQLAALRSCATAVFSDSCCWTLTAVVERSELIVRLGLA